MEPENREFCTAYECQQHRPPFSSGAHKCHDKNSVAVNGRISIKIGHLVRKIVPGTIFKLNSTKKKLKFKKNYGANPREVRRNPLNWNTKSKNKITKKKWNRNRKQLLNLCCTANKRLQFSGKFWVNSN